MDTPNSNGVPDLRRIFQVYPCSYGVLRNVPVLRFLTGGEVVTRGRLYLVMLAGWVAFTLTLTSIPNPEFGPSFPGADKVAHFGFYGVAGFLFVLWRREIGTGAAGAMVWAAIFSALLGAVDEFHQQWIPGRSMELLDWAA